MEIITNLLLLFADFFLSVGLGLGRTDTPQATQRKSMSNERTFSPTEDEASLLQKLGNKQCTYSLAYFLNVSHATPFLPSQIS